MSERDFIELKSFNPVGLQLLRYVGDTEKRLIICYGGSSSGKSYSVAQVLLLLTFVERANSLVLRKVGSSIYKSIYEDFRQAAIQLRVSDHFTFRNSVRRIINNRTGAHIDFAGLDDPEKIKGISNYRWVFMDECSEFDEIDFKQIRKRLRGRRGQQIVIAFNPIKETHWIKKNVIDRETWHDVPMRFKFNGVKLDPKLTQVKSLRVNSSKSVLNPRTGELEEHAPDTVLIQSTYLNNFWVVGSPDGTYGYYDEQCIADFEKDRLHDPDYYNVYALGEWGVIRTGSEFFGSFNRAKHCGECAYDPDLPIHLSVDSNVLPYISISYWQADLTNGVRLRQIGETCAANPDNTVRKSAKLVAERLKGLGCLKVYLHGDASTRNANNIDDNKRSFHDLFISHLQADGIEVVDKVGNKNPNVAMSGEFINAVWDGILPELSITIDNSCGTSIEDYLSVQKDDNGGILKTRVKNKTTGQSYEEHAHLADTFRYVVCDLMRDEFLRFSNRRKRNLYAKDGAIRFFNADGVYEYKDRLVYTIPNINGKFVMVYGAKCGDKWHIIDIAFTETTSTDEIKERILGVGSPLVVVECAEPYFPMVRDMRESSTDDIRVKREVGDVDRRIAATSDYTRDNVLFNADKTSEEGEYSAFMSSLLDYNRDSQNKEASAVLSGFIQFVIKLQ